MTTVTFFISIFLIILGAIFMFRGLFRKQHVVNSQDDSLPLVPTTFDLPFIEKQLIKIQNSPSLIDTYLTSVKTKYNLAKETQVIEKLAERYLMQAAGPSSQITTGGFSKSAADFGDRLRHGRYRD